MRFAMSVATAAAYHAARDAAPDPLASRLLKEQFFGTWKLVSWEIEQANGEPIDSPLGPAPVGWIMYQPEGHMSVVLMRPDRPKFASNNLMEGTPEEIKAAFEGYVSYCGSYEVNEQEHLVIHRLQLSWFPNLVGTEQKRFFEFAGDRLTLKTPPLMVFGKAQVHRLIWQRLWDLRI
jgi:hypothetical protein